jgi:hypothetical protein
MFSDIKLATNGNKYLWFRWKNKTICIFENQKELINNILEKLNIVDSDNIADLNYLRSKLNRETGEVFYKCWLMR